MKKIYPKSRVIKFSGGRTSALMTIREYREGDIVLFTDTGREHPKTYKFINDFEAHEGIPVHRAKFSDTDDPFGDMLVKRNHSIVPYAARRVCTSELKIRTAKRYLKSLGILHFEQMIGFRADEPQRVRDWVEDCKKVKTLFPLFDQGITKPMVLEYWKGKPYDLEIPAILGNCTLCFMKGKNAIMAILRHHPEFAEPWIQDEIRCSQHPRKKRGGKNSTYFHGVSMAQMRDIAQNNLFKDYNLDELTPAMSCTCTA